jgi:hypothetical protein
MLRLLAPVEALQHHLAFSGWNTWSGIGDADLRAGWRLPQFHLYGAALRRELDCVIHQITERLEQQTSVSANVGHRLDVHDELNRLAFG